jgi:hypothetical protein
MWIAEPWRYPGWPGRRLRIGGPVGAQADCRQFGGRMALDCGVVSGGRIAVGDPVEPMEDGEEA